MKSAWIFISLEVCLTCAFFIGCGGGSSHGANNIVSSGNNVAAISVNGGPPGNYADAAFVSVTVCVPGTSTCQPVDDVLVDTGSFGLRILSSALTKVSLPQQQASDGNPVAECLTFLASYTWGPVQTADVQIAGEKASSVPIQVLSDTDFPVPSQCTSSGFKSADTLDRLGANGLLGVGLAAQDCGNACVNSTGPGLYFKCPSSGCVPTVEALAQQVVNPVALFATDNNGVIVELPAVSSGGAASVSGSLVFGIGTQSNNGLGGAKVYTAPDGSLTTSYNGQSYPGSFLDSGSNGYFFLDSSLTGLTNCPNNSDAPGFYCPANSQNFTATNQGSNGASGTVSFSIASAVTLFANQGENAFSNLGGPSGNSAPFYFDFGLPFFFGRNVFVAIDGASTPGGVGPYWAY
jgi:hypothetical protein